MVRRRSATPAPRPESGAPSPGRSCPLRYRYRATALRADPVLEADTLYVVGGLYGNVEALREILAMKRAEERRGARVTLLFNGDFNWFDTDDASFTEINHTVLAHAAIMGNVEAELGGEGDAGCGCAYPAYVDQATVDRSNDIMRRLQARASRHRELTEHVLALPMHATVAVGGTRIGVVHGDPESLAGWGFAVENMAPPDEALRARLGCAGAPVTSETRAARYFESADVRVFACTHTCLPFMQDVDVAGERCVVANNGSAGMPNFRASKAGLVTRISSRPAPGALYGTALGELRVDAVPVVYDHAAWLRRFAALWPEGSPARLSYWRRIVEGPDFETAQAVRLRGK